MHFSKLILLLFILEIDRGRAVKTTSIITNDNAEAKMENLLIEFMTDMKKINIDTLDHPWLIVLGKKKRFLQATKVLLENGQPNYIGTEAEAIVLPWHFSVDSVVLFFVDGFSESELTSTLARLPKSFRFKVLLLSLAHKWADKWIATMMLAKKLKLKNVSLAVVDNEVVKIYGHHRNEKCEMIIKLINTWTPKKGFRNNENIFQHQTLQLLNGRGCPVFVSTFELFPTMMLREDENKSWHITGGVEGGLAEAVAQHLNMEIVVRVPSVKEQLWVTPNGTISGIVGDVAKGLVNFGIGQIKPTPRRAAMVDFTMPYSGECMTWTVPRSTKYNYSIVTSEFSFTTWILVILSVSLYGLVYSIPKLFMGHRSSLNIFDVIAMTLNYAIPRNPSGLLCKLLFLLYLNYSRIISTAYSTSLSSILTTTTPQPTIVDEEGIIAAGLRTAGSASGRDSLADQIPANSTRSELINRYEVITSVEAALTRIANSQDIAYLRPRSTVNYFANNLLMAGKPLKFYLLPGCIFSYYSVIVTPKGSPVTDRINFVILRLRESGILRHWETIDRTASRFEIEKFEHNYHALARFESLFVFYLCCLVPAFLAFFTELIAFKLQLNWFGR